MSLAINEGGLLGKKLGIFEGQALTKKLAEVATFFLRPKGFQEAYLFVMLLAKQANLKYKLKYPT
jgi:hypothetical protein